MHMRDTERAIITQMSKLSVAKVSQLPPVLSVATKSCRRTHTSGYALQNGRIHLAQTRHLYF